MSRWDDKVERIWDDDDRYDEDIELLEKENLLKEEEERRKRMNLLLWEDEQNLLYQAALEDEDLYD